MTETRAIALRLSYDGAAFHGSARQTGPGGRDRVRTVASVLAGALERLYGRVVGVSFASRTDAGVHALGQLAAFVPPNPIPPAGVRKALDDRLPADLAVRDAGWIDAGLDVRRDNGGKRYRYAFATARARHPFVDRWAYRVGRPLDVAAMRRAAAGLVGRHDFAGFRAADCQARTTVRTIRRIEIAAVERAGEPLVEVTVEGDAFLKNMVRILAGTLYDVGRGRFDPARALRPLTTADRCDAGPTAPPHGLTLVEVLWPHGWDRHGA